MGRIARRIDKEKISRLRILIDDPTYLTAAVEGLALRMTNRLVLNDTSPTSSYRSINDSNSIDALLRVPEE